MPKLDLETGNWFLVLVTPIFMFPTTTTGVKYSMRSTPVSKIKKGVYQVFIAQWLAWRLATGEVLCTNSGKGDNLLISD